MPREGHSTLPTDIRGAPLSPHLTALVADDWHTTFHTGLAAELRLPGPDGLEPFALGDRRLVIRAEAA